VRRHGGGAARESRWESSGAGDGEAGDTSASVMWVNENALHIHA